MNNGGVRLEPPQDEGAYQLPQPLRRQRIAVTLNGQGELGPEVLLRPQIARIQEVHDRPQLGEAVLHRGAGEGQAEVGREATHGLGLLGRRVLDVLRLVQDDLAPAHLRQQVRVAAHQAVAGDDHVVLLSLIQEILTARPPSPVMKQRAQVRGEALDLPLPVARHRSGTND